MKHIVKILFGILCGLVLVSCGGIKVLDAWKSPEISTLKEKQVLVIARTQNDNARRAFERDLADALIDRGINATPSFSKFPPLVNSQELTEERMSLIKEILEIEGFNAVVITSIKDIRERTTSAGNNYYYFNDPWSFHYPSYFGSFYGYYYQPYYSINLGNSNSYTTKTFYLESVAYDLKASDDKQLLAVVTTKIEDPKTAYKISGKFTEEILKALSK